VADLDALRAGHSPWLEQPAALSARLREFVKRSS
jgi:pimeloyl-ACP methyl ester carboxylesterase